MAKRLRVSDIFKDRTLKSLKKILRDLPSKLIIIAGYGAAHVPTDLAIVGKGWWLERGEYDGSEWWNFKETPKQINEVRNISCLVGGMWPTLKELNNIDPIQERLEEMRKERG